MRDAGTGPATQQIFGPATVTGAVNPRIGWTAIDSFGCGLLPTASDRHPARASRWPDGATSVVPDGRRIADADRREQIPDTRRYLGSPGRPVSRGRQPARADRQIDDATSVALDVWQEANVGHGDRPPPTHSTQGSTGRPSRPLLVPRADTGAIPPDPGQAFGPSLRIGENPNSRGGSSDPDRRSGRVAMEWAAAGRREHEPHGCV